MVRTQNFSVTVLIDGKQGYTKTEVRRQKFKSLIKKQTFPPSRQHGTGTKTEIQIRNRTESPEIYPCTYGHLIYDKGGKTIQWRKDSLFSKYCWENWIATYKRMKLEHSLTSYTKINSKCIKELNVRPDTTKLYKENISRTLFFISCSKIFFDPPPRIMKIETKTNKWDLTKCKSFCRAKKIINKVKRQSSEWEKIFAHETTDKGSISKIYKQLMQLISKTKNKKPTTQSKNGSKI